jgi:hypothetical protein
MNKKKKLISLRWIIEFKEILKKIAKLEHFSLLNGTSRCMFFVLSKCEV